MDSKQHAEHHQREQFESRSHVHGLCRCQRALASVLLKPQQLEDRESEQAMKWNKRAMQAAIGACIALGAIVVGTMVFDATEPDGVPPPDGAPSTGPGDEYPAISPAGN